MTRPPARSDRSRGDRRPRPPRRDAGRHRPAPPEEVNPAELPTDPPPALPEGGLRVVALGGIGEIGRNMTVFEYDGRLLIVDCGVLFPRGGPAGRRPDPARLPGDRGPARRHRRGRAHPRPRGPHRRGAVPAAPAPGPARRRVAVHARAGRREVPGAPAHPAPARGAPRASAAHHGPFDCEFFAVNHSIPDALAVAIRTPAGTVLHTGDIKLDQLPLDGRLTDLAGFSRLGDEGVDLFLVDSTNAEVPGFVTAEREIGPVIDGVFHRPPQRLIVACFASHVHRVQQVLDAAAEARAAGSRFVGRSMVRNMGIAAGPRAAATCPTACSSTSTTRWTCRTTSVVLVSTGSQGEPLSALSRMARGDHRQVTIRPGDTVILRSAR